MVIIETGLKECSAERVILLHDFDQCLAQLLDLSIMEALAEEVHHGLLAHCKSFFLEAIF